MLKILVMEDDPSVASLIRHQLEGEGYAAIQASDADAAWGMLLTEDPDGAIVDLWIGGVQAGWNLVERLRKNEALATLPVVVVTGASGAGVDDRARELGCEFLSKPFSAAALVDRLQRAVRLAGRSPGRRAVPVVMLVGPHRIRGDVHLPADLPRFTDAWEAVIHDSRDYLPVTDATVTTLDGSPVTEAPFLAVRKAEISAAHPFE